jgi:single-strand DNA-binding protein
MAYKDLVATIGTYEKDGQTKYVTRKVGTLLETDKGIRVKLDACFSPAGCRVDADGSVWLAAFDPKPREQLATPAAARSQPKHSAQTGGVDDSFFNDDIGF